jgi:hypothetical protein
LGPITSAAAQTARWFTPAGSIRRIHRRQAQEIFAEQACAKDEIVEPIQQINPTGKSPQNPVQPFAQKYSAFAVGQITDLTSPVSPDERGGSRSSRTCGGMRWTRELRLTSVTRADGEAVWS